MHDPLVPRAALPYLEVEVLADRHRVELAPLRREALEILTAGYRSPGRLALGLLAWVAVVGGAVLLSYRTGVAPTIAAVVLLAGGLTLGAVVLRAGGRLTRAAADWLQVPAVGASGRDAGSLYGVVRGRVALALLAGCLAVALLVLLATASFGTGALAGAVLGHSVSARGMPPDAGLLATLAVTAGATSVVAVASFVGVRRVVLAAWARPTVAPAPPPGATPVPAVWAPHRSELPTVELDLRSPPDPPGGAPPSPPAPAAGRGVEVLLSSGVPLRPGITLLGRSPVARPGEVVDQLLVLSDQTVTKTHATITVAPDAVTVVDRASTNGTLLERPDGSLVRCRPWQVTTVRSPAIIHLGHTRLLVRPLTAHRSLEVA